MPPATLLFGEIRTNRIISINDNQVRIDDLKQQARDKDVQSKAKSKEYNDKRRGVREVLKRLTNNW